MFDEYQLGLYEGKMNEQDRIISLIEGEANNHGNPNVVNMLFSLIALIKGENE